MQTRIVLLLALLVWSTLAIAQDKKGNKDEKDIEVRYENVISQCADKPRAERVRVGVLSFSTTTRSIPPELGKNMASMLTNVLSEINCFRVMELQNFDRQLNDKMQLDRAYYDQDGTAELIRNIGAQVLITGEITEYSKATNSNNVLGVSGGKENVKLGFILKFINPNTLDLLWSKSIDVEGLAKKGTELAVLGGRIKLKGKSQDDPALSDALETGMLIASELIVANIDDIELPEVSDPDLRQTLITIEGADYMKLRQLENEFKILPGVASVKKSLSDARGSLEISHNGSTDELLDQAYTFLTDGLKITEVDPEKGIILLEPK